MAINEKEIKDHPKPVFYESTKTILRQMANNICKINIKYLSKDIKSYLEALKRGMPTLFRQGFATGSNIILNFLAKPYGDSLVAALGITAKLYMIVRNIIIIIQTITPITNIFITIIIFIIFIIFIFFIF